MATPAGVRTAVTARGPDGARSCSPYTTWRATRARRRLEHLLVRRMDVVGVADVDGNGESAPRILGGDAPLRLAPAPNRCRQGNRRLAIVGQLRAAVACVHRTDAANRRAATQPAPYAAPSPVFDSPWYHSMPRSPKPPSGASFRCTASTRLPRGKWRRLLARAPIHPRSLQWHPLGIELQAVPLKDRLAP